MTSYLSGIQVTKNGYLLLPEHDDQENEPLVLESADQLWFKLHPQHDEIIFHDEASNVQMEIETQAPPSLENLQRFFDMSNKVVPVIEDIVKMQDRERFLSRKQREKREQSQKCIGSRRHSSRRRWPLGNRKCFRRRHKIGPTSTNG